MAAKQIPQSGSNPSGADSFNPRGHPATSYGPAKPSSTGGSSTSPQFSPKNGYVTTRYHDPAGNIGTPTTMIWRFGQLVDTFNVIP
jgi:hypothetical protein